MAYLSRSVVARADSTSVWWRLSPSRKTNKKVENLYVIFLKIQSSPPSNEILDQLHPHHDTFYVFIICYSKEHRAIHLQHISSTGWFFQRKSIPEECHLLPKKIGWWDQILEIFCTYFFSRVGNLIAASGLMYIHLHM